MMGRQTTDQHRLFYEFDLDERIASKHLLPRINIFVTLAYPICIASLKRSTPTPADPRLIRNC